jgi:hypothetical protein
VASLETVLGRGLIFRTVIPSLRFLVELIVPRTEESTWIDKIEGVIGATRLE